MDTREHKTHHFFTLFLLLLLVLQTLLLARSCIDHERQALLEFKAGVDDPCNRLDSWRGDECCKWAGITCNNQTSHVVSLNLQNPYRPSMEDPYYDPLGPNYYSTSPMYMNHSLSGMVSPSLLALKNLEYLDLSYNNFSEVPRFIGSFEKLKYLNLSNSYFPGKIPPQLGNLSQLQFLDLSLTYFQVPGFPTCNGIWWVSHLTSLRHLDMTGIDLQDPEEWVQPLNKLPLLEVLILKSNGLTHISQSLPFSNFTSLRVLQLSNQNFNTTFPSWISSLHGLTHLNLEFSNFVGRFPDSLGNLSSISELVLDGNNFYGKLPLLHNLTKLTYLSLSSIPTVDNYTITEISSRFTRGTWKRLEGLILSDTNLNGPIPDDIRDLTNMKYLDLHSNNLSGPIPSHIGDLTNLKYLYLQNNDLSGPIPDDIGDLTNLKYLYLGGNNLSGPIPNYIGNLTNLVELDLSYNSFTGFFTKAHLDRLSKLKTLKLDNNPITIAMEANWEPSFQLHILSLDSCRLGPIFPAWLRYQVEIVTVKVLSRVNTIIPEITLGKKKVEEMNSQDRISVEFL